MSTKNAESCVVTSIFPVGTQRHLKLITKITNSQSTTFLTQNVVAE